MKLAELFDKAYNASFQTIGLDVGYAIEEDDNTVYLFFQGTHDNEGWVLNFQFPAIPYSGENPLWFAHGGFVDMWKSVCDLIVAEVLLKLATKKLIIAGFSQGAALTVLAHEDFVYRLGKGGRIESFAFAPPRVVWLPPKAVRERMVGLHTFRLRGDIVPMVPFWWMGFFHAGTVTKIGKLSLPWFTKHSPTLYSQALPDRDI